MNYLKEEWREGGKEEDIETLYLLRSPANAARLTAALERSKTDVIQPQSIDALCAQFGLNDIDTEGDRLLA
jgi:antitoxin YefM